VLSGRLVSGCASVYVLVSIVTELGPCVAGIFFTVGYSSTQNVLL